MIKRSPQQNETLDHLSVSKQGEVYLINGITLDFSQLMDGDYLPHGSIDCEYIASDVERVGGELNMTLLSPYTGSGTQQERFPDPVDNEVDGVLI